MNANNSLDGHLSIGAIRASEAAAIAAAKLTGMGDERKADEVASAAMIRSLNVLSIDGTIVVSKGRREEESVLYVGEKVGTGQGPKIDIAVDPLEGATITATGASNAMSVIAFSEAGGLLQVPDTYMNKLAVGGGLPDGLMDLDAPPVEAIRALAFERGVQNSDIMVCVLNRPRNEELIAQIRQTGARVTLIPDGDIAGVIATSTPSSGVDMYYGIGGASQGVLAAAALSCVGGQMQTRLLIREEGERLRANAAGINNVNQIFNIGELVSGNVIFAATGITNGNILRGVRWNGNFVETHSLVMRSQTGTLRWISSRRDLSKSPLFETI